MGMYILPRSLLKLAHTPHPQATNGDVYNGTIRDLVVGVLYGVNTTVFAYGATGSGKTYTMVWIWGVKGHQSPLTFPSPRFSLRM